MNFVFAHAGTFEACDAAEKFLADHGFSVGRPQGRDPRGVLVGDFEIMKWRNLDSRERAELDGKMTGNMREGPVMVEIFDARPLAIAAITKRDMAAAISPSGHITIQMLDAPGLSLTVTTITEFAEANDYDAEQLEVLLADLREGRPHMVGGGSAPLFQIEKAL